MEATVRRFFKRKLVGTDFFEDSRYFLYRKRFNKTFLVFVSTDLGRASTFAQRVKRVNVAAFVGIDDLCRSGINKVAVLPYAKSIVYVVEKELCTSLPEYVLQAGLVRVDNGSLLLQRNGVEDVVLELGSVQDDDFTTEALRIICENFELIVTGRISAYDILKNVEKRLYFMRRNEEHQVLKISGKKIETAEFCIANCIRIPELIFAKNNGEVVRRSDLFQYPAFVVKENSGCSSQRVHVFQLQEGGYQDLLGNLPGVLDTASLLNLLDNYKSCIVEQKLGNDGRIPYDLKIYCYDRQPRLLVLIDRNYKLSRKKVYVKIYDFGSKSFIENFFLNDQVRFRQPDERLNDLYSEYVDADLLSRVQEFCDLCLNKIDYDGFISLDLFEYEEEIYLGEFTKTPGAFLYHINPGAVLDDVFRPSGSFI